METKKEVETKVNDTNKATPPAENNKPEQTAEPKVPFWKRKWVKVTALVLSGGATFVAGVAAKALLDALRSDDDEEEVAKIESGE